jgi:hypothetical protein
LEGWAHLKAAADSRSPKRKRGRDDGKTVLSILFQSPRLRVSAVQKTCFYQSISVQGFPRSFKAIQGHLMLFNEFLKSIFYSFRIESTLKASFPLPNGSRRTKTPSNLSLSYENNDFLNSLSGFIGFISGERFA